MNTERYTKKDAEQALVRFLSAINKPYGYDEGCYHLDYNATYGGCLIHCVVNKGGGVSTPFGMHRMSPYDFCSCINFAIKAIELNKLA
jgi:hypothetical protein